MVSFIFVFGLLSVLATFATGNDDIEKELPQIACKYLSCPVAYDGSLCHYATKWGHLVENVAEYTCFTNTNITLDDTNPNFRFNRLSEEQQVTSVIFREFKMHLFTKDTCMEFTSLQSLHVFEVGLKLILSDALKDCLLLKTFSATENQLFRISSGTFTHNPTLEHLSLSQNNISIIEPNAFDNMDNLLSLDLEDNYLQRFPGDVGISQMNKLVDLFLMSENLKEVDTEEMLMKIPNLKNVMFCKDGIINYEQVEQKLKSRNVDITCPTARG